PPPVGADSAAKVRRAVRLRDAGRLRVLPQGWTDPQPGAAARGSESYVGRAPGALDLRRVLAVPRRLATPEKHSLSGPDRRRLVRRGRPGWAAAAVPAHQGRQPRGSEQPRLAAVDARG